jgi:DNA-binding MarR family transcriptional regulator
MKKITYSAPSVKKAFRILDALSNSPRGLGVTDLSKQLKIGKSTVLGITTALEELGLLARDPVQKKYSVGYTLLELGRKAHTKMELKEIARRPMENLMAKVGRNDRRASTVNLPKSRDIPILDVWIIHHCDENSYGPNCTGRLPILDHLKSGLGIKTVEENERSS